MIRLNGHTKTRRWEKNVERRQGDEVQIIATSTDGKKFGGFSWRTREGINVKQDLLYKEGNEKSG